MRFACIPTGSVVLTAVLILPAPPAALVASAAPIAPALTPTTTVYLPNITKMLGGPDGWQTPFIVQNTGSVATDLELAFYRFADGGLVKTRTVGGLRPGTSISHDPNSDADLAAGGQYSVVIRSFGAPIVSVVNEHQNVADRSRQEALSYDGISGGSTKVFLPYVAKSVGGWLTTFVIQNLGGATASVAVTFAGPGGKQARLTRTMGPGRSQVVDPTVESALEADVEYAATLTSDQPIGVVVNAHNDAPESVAPMGFSYNGVPDCTQRNAYVPFVARNVNEQTTRLFVQNMSAVADTPKLDFYYGTSRQVVGGLASLASGAALSADPRSLSLLDRLGDVEYSLIVLGSTSDTISGRFAVVAATIGPASAHGTTGFCGKTIERNTRSYLPNVTRTLGGTEGWTTSVVVQANYTGPATLRWYRFADGALVHTQQVITSGDGSSARIDPRSIAALSDDTQYAVVVEGPRGLVASAITTAQGGDGAMTYEGFPVAPAGDETQPRCIPAHPPGSSWLDVLCLFPGLPPNGTFTETDTKPGQAPRQIISPFPLLVDADGVAATRSIFIVPVPGMYVETVQAGGISRTATYTIDPATFAVAINTNVFGSVSAVTKPGAVCVARLSLTATGVSYSDPVLKQTRIADAGGNVSWLYGTMGSHPSGPVFHDVACVSGDEYQSKTGATIILYDARP